MLIIEVIHVIHMSYLDLEAIIGFLWWTGNGRILIAPVPFFFQSRMIRSFDPFDSLWLFFFVLFSIIHSLKLKPWCPPRLSQDKTPYLHFISLPFKFDFRSEIQGLWPCRRKTDMKLGMIWTSVWFSAHSVKTPEI